MICYLLLNPFPNATYIYFDPLYTFDRCRKSYCESSSEFTCYVCVGCEFTCYVCVGWFRLGLIKVSS